MFKHIAITGRIDTLNNLLAANPREIEAEYRLANSAPALRLALLACLTEHDNRMQRIHSTNLPDPAHIAAARQLLNSL